MELVKLQVKNNTAALKDHGDRINANGEKIVELEKDNINTNNTVNVVCAKMSSLTKAIWFLGTSIFLALLGFAVWCLQQLGGRIT